MSLDMPIVDWCIPPGVGSRSNLRTMNAVGIELEYENVILGSVEVGPDWSVTDDGSLRNRGVELVSRPLLETEIESALRRAEAILTETGGESTPRCGLHTHMNMRPYSIGQVWSLACLYALIEPTLFSTYAQGRSDSVFAVPLWANTAQQTALHDDICRARSVLLSVRDCTVAQTSKYAALNFSSLNVFGTLEMRQPYCSTDFAAIRSWVDFCFRLARTGVSYHDPLDVLSWYESEGLDEVQRTLFGDTFEISEEQQELAEDTAYMTCGYAEPTWQELTWEIA